ncbi:MAG: serine hydrolase [Mycobacteriales bacterium]
MARTGVVSALGGTALQRRLAIGTVSAWCGRPGAAAAWSYAADVEHYAASTIKLAVLVAAYRLSDTGRLDLDQQVIVHDEFDSVVNGTFRMDRGYDNDEEPWERIGTRVPLRWLARRMIVRSSNLATSLLLESVPIQAVDRALAVCGATRSALRRPISDTAAIAAGITNVVTAADLAAILAALATSRAASAASCAEMLDVLSAQEYRDEIPAALPAGVPVASKGGWVEGIQHDAALITAPDAPAYILVVCTTGLSEVDGRDLIREISAAAWSDRHSLGSAE